MSSSDNAVACGCGRSYKWKAELAGKKAKCKCGATVRFPVEAPVMVPREADLLDEPAPAPAASDGGEYDFHEAAPAKAAPPAAPASRGAAAGPVCKGCGAALPQGTVLCTACGMNQTTGKKLGTAIERTPIPGAFSGASSSRTPAKAGGGAMSKWIWMVGALGAAVAAILVGLFVMPEMGEKIFAGIGIVGLIISSIGSIWSIWVATGDNIGLRLLCRFVPFVGLVVVVMKSISDWDEMKAPVLTMLTGIGVGGLGLVMWLGATAQAAGH